MAGNQKKEDSQLGAGVPHHAASLLNRAREALRLPVASLQSRGPFAAPIQQQALDADEQASADIIDLPDDRRQRLKKKTSGSENRQRVKAVRVRLLPADHERLQRDALAAGMSLAGYLATGRLNKEATNRPRMTRRRSSVDIKALTDALVSFNRVGNNQNQVARALNELLLIADQQSNGRLMLEVESLADDIRGLPLMFVEPVAAIMAALHPKKESDD